MKRALVSALIALAFPSAALAGPCGLPDGQPVWVDFGAQEVKSVMARPGTVLAISTGNFPTEVRAAGARTVFWDMNLRSRVGIPTAPVDPALIPERANRLYVFAASQSQCATPWIALNELFGANLETPWTPGNAQYRANVLTLVRELAARGARPFLLISSPPYTGSEDAAAWWRAVAQVADLVPEVYFNGRSLAAQGPLLANRRVRAGLRRGVARLVEIGIPVTRIGLMLGFQSAPGTGGREGLSSRQEWFRVIKWQALAAREIAAEMNVATVWSWGWGTYSEAGRDPDKVDAACAYLWARDSKLCNAPALLGPGFNAERGEGQLRLPGGAMCRVGANTIGMVAIARLNRLVEDRDVAYSALLARITEAGAAKVTSGEVRSAESAVIALRFGGNRSAYIAALARERASVELARGILADQLRRAKLAARMRVGRPSSTSVATFYFSYPDLQVRTVEAAPAPWWLGNRRTGLAIQYYAPDRLFAVPTGQRATLRTLAGSFAVRPLNLSQQLAAIPLDQARQTISAVLAHHARLDATVRWSAARQASLLNQAICRRDDFPQPAATDLTAYLPFLTLPA